MERLQEVNGDYAAGEQSEDWWSLYNLRVGKPCWWIRWPYQQMKCNIFKSLLLTKPNICFLNLGWKIFLCLFSIQMLILIQRYVVDPMQHEFKRRWCLVPECMKENRMILFLIENFTQHTSLDCVSFQARYPKGQSTHRPTNRFHVMGSLKANIWQLLIRGMLLPLSLTGVKLQAVKFLLGLNIKYDKAIMITCDG